MDDATGAVGVLHQNVYFTRLVKYRIGVKYDSATERVRAAFAAVLPSATTLEVTRERAEIFRVQIGATSALIRWLDSGWPDWVRQAYLQDPDVVVFAAPSMSTGSRELLEQHGYGWLDETGAAKFALADRVVVVRDGMRQKPRAKTSKVWTPATFGVAEAILSEHLGIENRLATVAALADKTGLSTGACSEALSRLTKEGLLLARTERGPGSARIVPNRRRLLEEYADAVRDLPVKGIRVGVLWRDPVQAAADAGAFWQGAGRDWAATGPLAAAVLAPQSTQIAPLQICVAARTESDILLAAREAQMEPSDGGRLLLRPFPTDVTARLSTWEHSTSDKSRLRCAPWPRVFADLRSSGVRGEDAAEHLREVAMGQDQ